jgi:thiamine kinase-like enzyme
MHLLKQNASPQIRNQLRIILQKHYFEFNKDFIIQDSPSVGLDALSFLVVHQSHNYFVKAYPDTNDPVEEFKLKNIELSLYLFHEMIKLPKPTSEWSVPEIVLSKDKKPVIIYQGNHGKKWLVYVMKKIEGKQVRLTLSQKVLEKCGHFVSFLQENTNKIFSGAYEAKFGKKLKNINTTELKPVIEDFSELANYMRDTRYYLSKFDSLDVTNATQHQLKVKKLFMKGTFERQKVDKLLDMLDEVQAFMINQFACPSKMVFTHGDLHGYNMLEDKNGCLYFIDWDFSRISLPESDVTYFAESLNNLELFLKSYAKNVKQKIILDCKIVDYYLYWRVFMDLSVYLRKIFVNTELTQNLDWYLEELHTCLHDFDAIVDNKKQRDFIINNMYSSQK